MPKALPRKKPLPPRAEVEIDWVAIREEWEQQDISDSKLAQRWGFKSATSIVRKRNKEGWTRNIDAIAARLVTQAVAHGEDTQIQHTTHTHTKVAHTPSSSSTDATASYDSAPLTRSQAQQRQRDEDSERDLGTAKHLATIHARAIRQQVGVADMAINTAVIFLDQIAALGAGVSESDPDGSATRMSLARHALLSVNPDKDTLQGTIKAVTALLEAGVKIKRLALGMDVLKNPEITPAHVANGTAAKKVIERLDVETLMKMRQAAQEISRLPPPTITQEGEDDE